MHESLATGLFCIPAPGRLARREDVLAAISADGTAVYSTGGGRSALASAGRPA